WNQKAGQIAECAAAAANEPDAKVIALINLDGEGKIQVEEGRFLISRAAWSKVRPKENDAPAYHRETDEERAARERQASIQLTARNFYGRSLVGETPGFEVTRCSVDWKGKLQIQLTANDEPRDDIT